MADIRAQTDTHAADTKSQTQLITLLTPRLPLACMLIARFSFIFLKTHKTASCVIRTSLSIIQTIAEGTPFSGCMSTALCDLRYVVP